jgi:LPXTG-motif cell wall-anchored protein
VFVLAFATFYLFPLLIAEAFDESHRNHPRAAALVFAITGLVFVAIGLLIARRRREAVPGAELL